MAQPCLQMVTVGVRISYYDEQPTVDRYGSEGTVKSDNTFDATADSHVLRNAMKGLGTDEKAIINVLAHRSSAQRQLIRIKYKTIFDRDLIRDLKSELSSHFQQAALALVMTPTEYDANELRTAMKGLGTDESVLIEILCTRSNQEIAAIKEQYSKEFGRDLKKDLVSETSGTFRELLVSLASANRDVDHPVNIQQAKHDAQALYDAGEGRSGSDESVFKRVFGSKSFTYLRAVFEQYNEISKRGIEEAVKRETSGDLRATLMTITNAVRDRPTYFAQKLHKSMKGLGTDDHTLVRVVVTRSEVDMVQIKNGFFSLYKQTLPSYIKGDTSGDYRRLLMALIGNGN